VGKFGFLYGCKASAVRAAASSGLILGSCTSVVSKIGGVGTVGIIGRIARASLLSLIEAIFAGPAATGGSVMFNGGDMLYDAYMHHMSSHHLHSLVRTQYIHTFSQNLSGIGTLHGS